MLHKMISAQISANIIFYNYNLLTQAGGIVQVVADPVVNHPSARSEEQAMNQRSVVCKNVVCTHKRTVTY